MQTVIHVEYEVIISYTHTDEATVVITLTDDMEQAISQAIQTAEDMANLWQLLQDTMDIPPFISIAFDFASYTHATAVEVPAGIIQSLDNSGLGLVLMLPSGTATLDPDVLQTVVDTMYPAMEDMSLILSINPIDITTLPPWQWEGLHDLTAVQVTLTANGVYLYDFNGVVQITVDYQGPLPVTVYRLSETGERITIDFVYDEDNQTVMFFTNQPATFMMGGTLVSISRQIALTLGNAQFNVDGTPYHMVAAPFVSNSRTMVPLRFMEQVFGMEVGWLSGQRTAYVIVEGTTLYFPINSITPELAALGLDEPARLVNGRTMVPLRFIAELLGAEVIWNRANREVIVRFTEPTVE